MTRPVERLLGRAAAQPAAFASRAYGTTAAEAAAIAASAARAPNAAALSGTTGPAGSGSNATTSTYSRPIADVGRNSTL